MHLYWTLYSQCSDSQLKAVTAKVYFFFIVEVYSRGMVDNITEIDQGHVETQNGKNLP